MATSSITHDIVISEADAAEGFVEAMEKASGIGKRKKYQFEVDEINQDNCDECPLCSCSWSGLACSLIDGEWEAFEKRPCECPLTKIEG